jgi:type II restriction enzyme
MDMQLIFNEQLATNYKSASQKAHVEIDKYPNNQPVADFFCSNCKEEYELKSKKNNLGTKVLDGAYRTKMERLRSSSNPNLFVLNYQPQNFSVIDFLVIPKHFFVPEIIEKRKPLTETARRAGWVGSNILLQKVPQAGKIFLVRQGQIESKDKVLTEWKKTLFLREEKEISVRGWLLDVMRSVEKLKKQEFTLDDVYAFEKELSILHPENKHIKDKIRQQLQVLRDKGYLTFVSRGYYRLT